jgi:hypothetical protein
MTPVGKKKTRERRGTRENGARVTDRSYPVPQTRKSVEVLRMERGRGSPTTDLSGGGEPKRETGALSGGGGTEGERRVCCSPNRPRRPTDGRSHGLGFTRARATGAGTAGVRLCRFDGWLAGWATLAHGPCQPIYPCQA